MNFMNIIVIGIVELTYIFAIYERNGNHRAKMLRQTVRYRYKHC